MQPTSIQEKRSSDNGVLLNLAPNWVNPSNQNNGTLWSLAATTNGLPFTQTFGYDALNRLTSASEGSAWSQSYNYDQYGNMWMPNTSGLPTPAIGSVAPTTNAYTAPNVPVTNRNLNSTYDNAGNLTVFASANITYDANNLQITAGSNAYAYDGLGQRVSRTVGSAPATYYVYDAFGQLSAEYTAAPLTIDRCVTCYLSYDHLGSPRMVTDPAAQIVALHDYAPFGQEIPAGVGGRTSLWGASDNANQRFTGQERDSETNLDFFQARYMSSGLGRFMSPDPANAGADLTNPQSWNAYAYVLGNPLANVDPTGMDCGGAENSDGNCTEPSVGAEPPGGDAYSSGATFTATGISCKWWQLWCWLGSGSSGGGDSSISPPINDSILTFYAAGLYLNTVSTPPTATLNLSTPQQSLMGPLKVLDCAGYTAARNVLPQTKAQGIEFGGFIYKNNQSSSYFYSAPFSGTPGALPSFDIHRTQDTPSGFSLAGWYHSHPLVPNYPHPELFSGADLGATRRVGGPGYLLTPSGGVLKLLPYPPNAPVAPTRVSSSVCQGG